MKRIFGFIMCVVLVGTLYGCMSDIERLDREIEESQQRIEYYEREIKRLEKEAGRGKLR